MATPDDSANRSGNIIAAEAGIPCWNCADAQASLQRVLEYVESEAKKAIDWYLNHKQSKAIISRWIQFFAIVLTALGGIFPIIVIMVNPVLKQFTTYQIPESGLASSLFVGLAASLFGVDKAFGFSSGWARYVLTATMIRKLLEEFRLDWSLLAAKACPQPSPVQIDAMMQRAKDFRVAVEALVLQETKDWVLEFQSNIAQMEKEARAQLEALKGQVDRAVEARATATRSGSIELTVANADRTDGYTYEVTLEDEKGKVVEERVGNRPVWTRLNVIPGHYKVSIKGQLAGKESEAGAVVVVQPNEIAKIELKFAE